MSDPRTEDPAGLRLEPLAQWLLSQGLIADETVDLRPALLAGGRSNISYRLAPPGRDWVLRRPPLGHVLPSAHDMGREYRVQRGLASVGFPVPSPIAECADPDVIGAPFYLMDFVDGRVVASAGGAQALGAAGAHQACASLVDTLARLHDVDLADAGLTDFAKAGGYLPRQAARWARQWELTRTQEAAAVDALRDAVTAAIDALPAGTGSTTLVHGDYRYDNVILAPDSDGVVAVLDWEMSTLGDPVVDLAVLLVYWTEAADVLRSRVPVAQHITDAPGMWDRAAIVERYAAASGRPLDHLDVCTALACFKLAVIMESIRYRALTGQQLGTGAAEADLMGAATLALAELGLAVLREGTLTGLSS